MILSKENKSAADAKSKKEKNPSKASPARSVKPGVSDVLAGERKDVGIDLLPYLPPDIVGGSIPHVPGTEDEAVWNAAAQACGTDRVHYTFTVDEGRCWYIACPSTSLASNPDSWCPIAAALPGNSEFWDRETVYLYEQEGMAAAMRWDPETGRMQVFLGASRTLLPRIQSMDANFVTIDPDVAEVAPWRNRALKTEKLARATANTLLLTGLLVAFSSLGFLMMQFIWTGTIERDLNAVQKKTQRASTDLMMNAYNALQSDTIKHMVRVQELLDDLQKIDGTLVRYELEKGKVTWEALVPTSFSNCTGSLAGCRVLPDLEPDGRVRIQGNK